MSAITYENIYSQARNGLGSFISEERRSMARSMAWIERHTQVLVTTVVPKRGVILCVKTIKGICLVALPSQRTARGPES